VGFRAYMKKCHT